MMHVKNLTDSYLELTKKASSSLITTLLILTELILLLAEARGVLVKDMVMVMVVNHFDDRHGTPTRYTDTVNENFRRKKEMEQQKIDLYRAYLIGKINALNGIKVSERASYNQKRLARRRMNVYFECLAKYNEIKNREAQNV